MKIPRRENTKRGREHLGRYGKVRHCDREDDCDHTTKRVSVCIDDNDSDSLLIFWQNHRREKRASCVTVRQYKRMEPSVTYDKTHSKRRPCASGTRPARNATATLEA